MMKKTILILSMAAALTSCHQNPFLEEWNTPYGIPPFDKVKISDYIPAIKAGIESQDAKIAEIVANPEAPTFENTIAPLELSGDILDKVTGVLFNVSETDSSPAIDAVVEEAIPLMSAHSADIAFNKDLYGRIAAIWNGGCEGLTEEQKTVVKNWFEDYERGGIGLCEEKQNRLREINTAIASMTQKIGNNILAESNAFKAQFGISVSEYPVAMTTTEDRDLREKMFRAYSMRGHNGNENDNRLLAVEVLKLRLEKARILGYANAAENELSDKMAHDPATVDKFLEGIMKAAVAKAEEEIAEMEKISGFKIEPWDWWYYSEKVRKAKYDLDDDAIRPYFKAENVVNGIFTCANILYGINMEKLEGVPAYNKKCVTTYKVTDADGSLIGIFTTDYYPRSSKRGGAWMNNIRNQYYDAEGNNIRPIIVNVGNLPEYMSVDDIQTVFHEFGHALHGLLTDCHYASVSGTSVTRDFVEMFSQFNENWAFQPWLLEKYATNKDGEVIPADLVEKIKSTLTFNQGFMTTELAAASILDMKWHEITEFPEFASDDEALAFVDAFEEKACREMGLIDEIIPRYRTTYFNHIFSSGYNAGYYGYLWAEVLDKDAFSIFCNKCMNADGSWDFDKLTSLASEFRKTFLEKGGSVEPMSLYKSFAGREPDSDAMLRGRGLK